MPQLLQAYEISRSIECPDCEANQIELHTTPVDSGEECERTCDLCSTTWKIRLTEDGAELTRTEKKESRYGYALLRYTGGGLPSYMIVSASLYYPPREPNWTLADALRHLKFVYEENTCPTDFIPVELISLNGNPDPHGVYELERFVSNQELKEKYHYTWQHLANTISDSNSEAFWGEVFPELLTHQPPNP